MKAIDPNKVTESNPTPIDADGQKVLRSLRPTRMVLPIALGIAGVAYLFYSQFDLQQFQAIAWTGRTFAWIGAALALMILRHLFYSFRMWMITGQTFSWRKCLELIVLWEFSSALTPTSKGGPFVMMFVLTQEKLSAGRTAAAVFYTMVCDSGFFILTLPVLLAIYGPPMLYPGTTSFDHVGVAGGAFFVIYSMMIIYWLVLVFFLFIRPQYAKNALAWLSRQWPLRRFAPRFQRLGDEFEMAATELRRQDWRYHLGVIGGTIGAWTCKFIMINCLIIAIVPSTPVDGATQAFLYARMVAMFIVMAFAPTPGGAGIAEVALADFTSDYVPRGIALVVALLWRGMAYYGYLLMGAFVVPNWIRGKLADAPLVNEKLKKVFKSSK